uniref:Uncharacterized protein n=1 Tax=Rhizophora mucronata TaxID=61149 RepID=A0A2P2N1T7_RHIMU
MQPFSSYPLCSFGSKLALKCCFPAFSTWDIVALFFCFQVSSVQI